MLLMCSQREIKGIKTKKKLAMPSCTYGFVLMDAARPRLWMLRSCSPWQLSKAPSAAGDSSGLGGTAAPLGSRQLRWVLSAGLSELPSPEEAANKCQGMPGAFSAALTNVVLDVING